MTIVGWGDATALEPSDSAGASSCGRSLDVKPGSVVTMRIVRTVPSEACQAYWATVTVLDGISYVDSGGSVPDGLGINFSGEVTKGQCKGEWTAILSGGVGEKVVAGRRPPAVLWRTFTVAPGVDPAVCGMTARGCEDFYVAEFSPKG